MTLWSRSIANLVCTTVAAAGCIPVPVSTVPLHPREERPIAAESAPAENYGVFSSPAFDVSGELLAVYDSGDDLIRILRSADLSEVDNRKPNRRPRRLSFSPASSFLVIESQPGWIDDLLSKPGAATGHIDIDSPEAIRDNIQRVEIWDLRSGEAVHELSCDAVVTSAPQGGWLWARKWAIAPGYRSSALLAAHFSGDEREFSVLCWDGTQQRWETGGWERLGNLPAPPFWDALMGLTTAQWLAGSDAASRSDDGRLALLRVRDKNFGFPDLYLWDRTTAEARKLPGACASRLQPFNALSCDGNRVVATCNQGLGYEVRVWDLHAGRELPLEDADFGFAAGIPSLRGEGVALSADGCYLAVALLGQMEALLPNVLLVPAGISRSDLRIWDVDTGQELVTVPIDVLDGGTYFRGVDLAFSPDGRFLAVSGRKVRLYRLEDLVTDRQLAPGTSPCQQP